MNRRFLVTLGITLAAVFAVLSAVPHAVFAAPIMFGTALAATNPTLLDLAKTLDPNGQVADIVEIMNQTNEVLDDMTWMEGNLLTGHRATIRAGIPDPTWRKLYGTVQPSKASNVQVTDDCGMLEAYADVDKALADLNGNSQAFRLTEDAAHIEGISREIAQTLFYGNNASEPEAFTGFAPRFNLTTAENGGNIVAADGSGGDSCTSIWLVVWGPRAAGYGIVPKGSKAGIQTTDKGQTTIQTSTGYREAYLTHYRMDAGLHVRDWRYIVRVANIKLSALTKNAATGADLFDLLSQALELVPNLQAGRPVLYCNRTIKSWLRRQAKFAVASSTLTQDMLAGRRVMFVDEVPVRRCDAILNTEAVVA
jgi:hypothetical protein